MGYYFLLSFILVSLAHVFPGGTTLTTANTSNATPIPRPRSGKANMLGFFKGSSLSLMAINDTTIRLTCLLAWDFDNGPCGTDCRPGVSTQPWRSLLVNQTGDPNVLGRWYVEMLDSLGNFIKTDITDWVNRQWQGEVLQVSQSQHWVIEKGQVDISTASDLTYIDVIMEGFSWTPELDLNSCTKDQVGQISGCSYYLQTKFHPGMRNDTNKPNHTPTVNVRPVYKVVAGVENKIPLVIQDRDGDAVKCRPARFVEQGPLSVLHWVNVEGDCTITVQPTGVVGGVGMVNFIVEDTPFAPITLENSYAVQAFDGISAVQVQFLIEVVSNASFPEFVNPTPCDASGVNPVSIISGATLRLPLCARASDSSPSGTKIERFAFNIEPDEGIGSVSIGSQAQSSMDSVSCGEFEWTVNVTEDTTYLLEVLAIDTQGEESVCYYEIQAEPETYSNDLYTNFSSGPLLSVPDHVTCELHSVCMFPVFAREDDTRFTIFDGPLEASGVQMVTFSSKPADRTKMQNITVLQNDVTVESKGVGDTKLCFVAVDWHGAVTTRCSFLTITEPATTHPCIVNDRLCGSRGRCLQKPGNDSDFLCMCTDYTSGKFCETMNNPCDYNYCGNNATMCFFEPSIASKPLCLCKKNYIGDLCDTNVLCSPDPCSPHGTCIADEFSTSYTCNCETDYVGQNCSERPSPLSLSFNTTEVTCYISEHLDWLKLPDPDRVAIVALTLSLKDDIKEGNKAAWSVNIFNLNPTVLGNNLTLATSANVKASFSSSGPASLSIVWPSTTPEQSGTYECTVGVINALGTPYQFSQSSLHSNFTT